MAPALAHASSSPAQPQSSLTSLERYALAAVFVALATAARSLSEPALSGQTPFAFYFIAVIAAAWLADFGGGIVATLASAGAADYFFIAPRFSLRAPGTENTAAVVLFIAQGLFISWLISRWRAAERTARAGSERLRERAERLEFQGTLLDQAYDAIFVRDAEARITLWNAGAERMYGWTAAEAIGRNAHELVGTSAEIVDAFTQALSTGPWSGQIRHRHRDGRALVSDSRQVRLPSGEVLEVNRDITAAREAQDALRASEQTMKALMDASTESIWLLDRERVLVANATAAQRLGLTLEQLVGARWRTLFPDNVSAHRGEKVEQVFASGAPLRFEDERGGIRFDHSFYPARDVAGEVIAVAAFSRDVTEQRQREDELRAMSQRLAYHVSHSPLAVIEFGPDMRVTRWTGAAERLFGWTADEVVGKRISDLPWVYDEDVAAVDAAAAALESGQDPRRFSANRNYRKDGTIVHCEWYNSSLVDNAGNLRSILSLVLDVTDRTHLEQELRTQAQELAVANRLKDDFLATLSHELRTPINAILGWAQILTMAEFSEERLARGLDTITRNARLQARMVEDLLDISRIVTGSVRLDLQPVELVTIVEQALDAVRPAAEAKRLTIDADVEPGLSVTADPTRLPQVLWNLLSNATKFTPAGGRISLSGRTQGAEVEITVADTGVGISPAFLPHVFERFRQADSSPTREHGGLGLGLAIVRHIIELHGGAVEARSDGTGHGATFIVRLPARLSGGAAAGAAPRRTESHARPLEALRILVVDDEPDARDMLATLLGAAGARVDTADSAAAAVARMRTVLPDVLISDIAMPGEDGYHFIRELRRSHSEAERIPSIALTAYGGATARDAALGAGFDRFMAKPVDADALISTIAELLAHPRA